MKKNMSLEVFEPIVTRPMKKRGRPYTPISDDYDVQCRLGDELMVWSEDEDVYSIEDFPLSKSMSPNKFYKIADTNDYFAGCLDVALQTIGSRLQRGWRDKTLDREYVMRILPLYNIQFKDLVLFRHKLAEENRNAALSGNVFHVNIPVIPALKEEPK